METELITIGEVVERTGMCRQSIRVMTRSGKLPFGRYYKPAKKNGRGRYIFSRCAFERWLRMEE